MSGTEQILTKTSVYVTCQSDPFEAPRWDCRICFYDIRLKKTYKILNIDATDPWSHTTE